MSQHDTQKTDLRDAMKKLIRAYVNLLETGRDRIVSAGGQCDPVDVMEAGDVALREARAALSATQPAQAAQSAPVGYAGYTSVQGFTAAFFPAEKIPEGTPLYIALLPAAGADVLKNDARYQWLRSQDDDDFVFAVVKNPHFDVYESPEELDAAIDAAIAASGRQE